MNYITLILSTLLALTITAVLTLWIFRKYHLCDYVVLTFLLITSILLIYNLTVLTITLFIIFLIICYLPLRKYFKNVFNPLDTILIILAVVGLVIILYGTSIIDIIVGFVISTLPIGFLITCRGDVLSLDSGLKYFVFSSIGFSLLITGTCLSIASFIKYLGFIFIIAGFGFELGFVPFHSWIPDVYDRSEPQIIAILASIPKIVTIIALIKMLILLELLDQALLKVLLGFIAIASMFLGNIGALMSKDVSRVLAYSTIAQMGYACIALTCLEDFTRFALSASIYQVIANALAKYSLFTAIKERVGHNLYKFSIYISVLSLIGIPPTLGFWAKLWLFQLSVMTRQYWLAISLIVNTAISVPYYIRVAKELTSETFIRISTITVITSLTSIPLLLLGVTVPIHMLNLLKNVPI